MIDYAKKAMEMALKLGADQAEVFVSESTATSIKIYREEVDELLSSSGSGAGIRVFKDRAMGYAYASDLTAGSLEAAAASAMENATVTAADEHVGLPEPAGEFPQLKLYFDGISRASLDDKIALAREAEAAALNYDDSVSQVEQATYHEAEASVALVNSLSFEGSYRESTCYVIAQVIATDSDQMQTGVSFSTGREPGQLDAGSCGREAAERAVSLLGAAQCESMTCPVIMDPFVSAGLIGVIGSVLTGESVQKQRSLFAGRENTAVAATAVTLIDDGIHPQGLASAPFDGEGVPSSQTAIIKNGVLQEFLYDTYTARKDGRASTGNGIRGSYRSMPHVGATNLRLDGHTCSRQDIMALVDKGLYVSEVSGIHSGANPVSGDFSVGAAGHLIEGGKMVSPVREVTIAGNISSMLKAVEVIGDDHRWIPFGGSIHAPTILISEMAVSGR